LRGMGEVGAPACSAGEGEEGVGPHP
jgi:hypothetical protein